MSYDEALKAAGAEVLLYESFGSYQGDWWAKVVKRGDRVAQILFVPVTVPVFNLVDEFTEATERGESGFGSTGK